MPADSTAHARPTPNRPEYGFLAWQATVGYIASEHNPDALLRVSVSPVADIILWQAGLSWGQFEEAVRQQPSLAAALDQLWRQVDQRHHLIRSFEASARRPVGYSEKQWLDTETHAALERILQQTALAFDSDWRLTILYQPVQHPGTRVQVRLTAQNGSVNVGGRGANLLEACRLLYRNAASEWSFS